MGERVERWKAREKVRSAVGWVAVFNALGGLFGVVLGVVVIAQAFGPQREGTSVSVFGYDGPPNLELLWGALILVWSAALLYCARGLWYVRTWARWATVVLCGGICVQGVLAIVRDRSISCGLPFFLFATVYLLLPSTGRRFALAQGASRDTDRLRQ